MPIAFVAALFRADSVAGPPFKTAPDAVTTAAKLLFGAQTVSTSFNITDADANTWTAMTGAQENTAPMYLSASYVNGGAPVTSSAANLRSGNAAGTGGAFYAGLSGLAFSGTADSPLGQQNSASGVGVTSLSTGSVTPSTGGEVVVSTITWDVNPGTVTPPPPGSGWVLVVDASAYTNLNRFAQAYKIKSAGDTSAENPPWSWTNSAKALGRTDTFKAAPSAPTVTTSPSNATVATPNTAGFTAAVSGTYTGLRWQRQAAGAGAWADVVGGTGGTTTSYTTGATAVSGGSFNSTDKFRLAVDWSGGTVYSGEAVLTVIPAGTAPSFTTQPTNQSATVGGTATFSVAAAGSGTLSYQWQRQPAAGGGYTAISGAIAASYTTPATTLSGGAANNGDTYRCVVTGDTAPAATSSVVTLTVQQPIATTFTFSLSGGNSLSSLKYAVFEHVTPDLWVAPIKKGANESTDGAGVCTIDVTGVTARRVGELGSVILTNSDGTATGGAQAATRKAAYYVGAFS